MQAHSCYETECVIFAVEIPAQPGLADTQTEVAVPSHGCMLHTFGDCGHIFQNTSNLVAY